MYHKFYGPWQTVILASMAWSTSLWRYTIKILFQTWYPWPLNSILLRFERGVCFNHTCTMSCRSNGDRQLYQRVEELPSAKPTDARLGRTNSAASLCTDMAHVIQVFPHGKKHLSYRVATDDLHETIWAPYRKSKRSVTSIRQMTVTVKISVIQSILFWWVIRWYLTDEKLKNRKCEKVKTVD